MVKLMTAPKNAPVSQADLERFQAYYDVNPAWGNLHIVLDDENIKDDHIEYCIKRCVDHGDEAGYYLGNLLLKMSKSQRLKISRSIV